MCWRMCVTLHLQLHDRATHMHACAFVHSQCCQEHCRDVITLLHHMPLNPKHTCTCTHISMDTNKQTRCHTGSMTCTIADPLHVISHCSTLGTYPQHALDRPLYDTTSLPLYGQPPRLCHSRSRERGYIALHITHTWSWCEHGGTYSAQQTNILPGQCIQTHTDAHADAHRFTQWQPSASYQRHTRYQSW